MILLSLNLVHTKRPLYYYVVRIHIYILTQTSLLRRSKADEIRFEFIFVQDILSIKFLYLSPICSTDVARVRRRLICSRRISYLFRGKTACFTLFFFNIPFISSH